MLTNILKIPRWVLAQETLQNRLKQVTLLWLLRRFGLPEMVKICTATNALENEILIGHRHGQ